MAAGDFCIWRDGMRKSYADYGITDEKVKGLLRECRAGKHGEQVRTAAYKACPIAAEHIILSIMKKKSYDALEIKMELGEMERIPFGRSDFYALRLYTLVILNEMLAGKEEA